MQPEIYTLSLSTENTQWRHRRPSSTLGLLCSALHLTLGALSVTLGIVGLVAEFEASKLGSALWSGLIFEACGVCGIVATRRWHRRSFARCFCITSGLAALVALLLFALTCVGVARHHQQRHGVANVSANIIVLSILEMGVSLASTTLAAKAARWRHPSSKDLPVVRQTFLTTGGIEVQYEIPDVVRSAPCTLTTVNRQVPLDLYGTGLNTDVHAYESMDFYF